MQLSQALKTSINAEMTRQSVSQRELARRLGWSQQYLWRRLSTNERADMELTPTELEKIAAALGVPVVQFLDTAERCPHGYHVTEGHCPTCDLDQDGKCGPYCTHDHGPTRGERVAAAVTAVEKHQPRNPFSDQPGGAG